MTTMITEDRFDALKILVDRYRGLPPSFASRRRAMLMTRCTGPVSAVLYISTSPRSPSPTALLASLHDLYTSNPSFVKYLDIHLILSPHSRQFNLQRNVARFFARTEFTMMLDVDFAICTSFRERILGSGGQEVRDLLRSGRAALVVPAFEFVDLEEGKDVDAFPKEKTDLVRLVEEGRIDVFHRAWTVGHSSASRLSLRCRIAASD